MISFAKVIMSTIIICTICLLLCSSGEEESAKVQQVFTVLSRDLRALADLPLSITSVQGASPVFSHTEVCWSLSETPGRYV